MAPCSRSNDTVPRPHAAAGDGTRRQADVEPVTWVRIAADGQVSTRLVPPFPQEIEEHESWLAATTQH